MEVEVHRDAAEVLKPCEQPLNLPPPLVAPKRSAVLRPSLLPVRLVRRDHLNAALFEFRVERVGVVSLIADQPPRPFSGKNFGESCLDKGDFMRASRRRVDGERKTSAVCHRHELRTFAPLGLSHAESPFLATINVASMKHSDKSRSPRSEVLRQSFEHFAQCAVSDPLLESAVAGLIRREAVGQVLPACAA
jgi:hypothetical protein